MLKYQYPTGHSMDNAAQPFRASDTAIASHRRKGRVASSKSSIATPSPPAGDLPDPSTEAISGPLSLLPDQIEAPAFLVDNSLTIRWMAPGGTDAFSRAMAGQLRSSSTRNVFNILLHPAIKHVLADWRAFFTFVYATLRHATTASAVLDAEALFISRGQILAHDDESAPGADKRAFSVDSCQIDVDEETGVVPRRVFSLKFGTGTLFLFRKDRWQMRAPQVGEQATGEMVKKTSDEKKIICVLTARLDHSHRLAESMLPQQFLKFMQRIWDEAGGIVRSLGGKRIGCGGAKLCCAFSESVGRNSVFSAICCATRLNRQMALLEEKLRVQQGWTDEIRLNMGIGHGSDETADPLGIDSAEFVFPGGAFDQSMRLSSVAGKGEIWITKDAVAQLPKQLIDQLVLGVERQGEFLTNLFIRLSDLRRTGAFDPSTPDIEALTITRVWKLERQNQVDALISED